MKTSMTEARLLHLKRVDPPRRGRPTTPPHTEDTKMTNTNQALTRNLPEVLPPGEGYWEAAIKYADFIESIDNSVAGVDQYGNLAWHVDCSARANGEGRTGAELEKSCLDTAIMIMDCWGDFYPWLILPPAPGSDEAEADYLLSPAPKAKAEHDARIRAILADPRLDDPEYAGILPPPPPPKAEPAERRVVRAVSLYTGDEHWVFEDDGSPAPYDLTPEVRWDEIQYLWNIREDGYPCDESGFPHCAECGQDVTAMNFFTGDDPAMKDYCEECAQRELGRRE